MRLRVCVYVCVSVCMRVCVYMFVCVSVIVAELPPKVSGLLTSVGCLVKVSDQDKFYTWPLKVF